MTPEERLAEQLDQKDEEIAELKEKLTEANRQLEWGTGWLRHTKIEDDGKLPVPRLEIVFRNEDYGAFVATYRMVKRHLAGELYAVPLGETRMSGYDSQVPDCPWRDGCHMAFDAAHLGLPAFLCVPDREPKPIDLPTEYPHQVALGHKARRP